jgi:hypothetical protein
MVGTSVVVGVHPTTIKGKEVKRCNARGTMQKSGTPHVMVEFHPSTIKGKAG